MKYKKIESFNKKGQRHGFIHMNKKDITPYNNKNQPHGYWKTYLSNGNISYQGKYINGKRNGIWMFYWADGKIKDAGQYINNKAYGPWNRFFNGKIHKFYYIT